MRARGVAALMTKTSGLSSRSMSSTVAPAARKSCGLGRAGMTTRSERPITSAIVASMAGGVSTTSSLIPSSRMRWISWASLQLLVRAKSGVSAARAFHHSDRLPCGSVSTSATGPKPVRSACTARCPASVVLPDPPFWEATAITCISSLRNSNFGSPSKGSYPISSPEGASIGRDFCRCCLKAVAEYCGTGRKFIEDLSEIGAMAEKPLNALPIHRRFPRSLSAPGGGEGRVRWGPRSAPRCRGQATAVAPATARARTARPYTHLILNPSPPSRAEKDLPVPSSLIPSRLAGSRLCGLVSMLVRRDGGGGDGGASWISGSELASAASAAATGRHLSRPAFPMAPAACLSGGCADPRAAGHGPVLVRTSDVPAGDPHTSARSQLPKLDLLGHRGHYGGDRIWRSASGPAPRAARSPKPMVRPRGHRARGPIYAPLLSDFLRALDRGDAASHRCDAQKSTTAGRGVSHGARPLNPCLRPNGRTVLDIVSPQ